MLRLNRAVNKLCFAFLTVAEPEKAIKGYVSICYTLVQGPGAEGCRRHLDSIDVIVLVVVVEARGGQGSLKGEAPPWRPNDGPTGTRGASEWPV